MLLFSCLIDIGCFLTIHCHHPSLFWGLWVNIPWLSAYFWNLCFQLVSSVPHCALASGIVFRQSHFPNGLNTSLSPFSGHKLAIFNHINLAIRKCCHWKCFKYLITTSPSLPEEISSKVNRWAEKSKHCVGTCRDLWCWAWGARVQGELRAWPCMWRELGTGYWSPRIMSSVLGAGWGAAAVNSHSLKRVRRPKFPVDKVSEFCPTL